MKRWLVTRVMKFTCEVEADTREEAIEAYNETETAIQTLRETAKIISNPSYPKEAKR